MKKVSLVDIAQTFDGEYIPLENCVKFKEYCVVANGYPVDITVIPTESANRFYVDTHCGLNAPLGAGAFNENGDVNFKNIFGSSAYIEMQNAGKEFSYILHSWIASVVSDGDG